MDSDFEVIASLDCRNGNCSTAWRSRSTGAVRFRGTNPATGQEIDVDWTAAEVAQLAPQLLAVLGR